MLGGAKLLVAAYVCKSVCVCVSEAAQPPAAAARPSFIHPAIDFVSGRHFLLAFIFPPPVSLHSALCVGATNNIKPGTKKNSDWLNRDVCKVDRVNQVASQSPAQLEGNRKSGGRRKRLAVHIKDAPLKNLRTSPSGILCEIKATDTHTHPS